MKYQKRSRFVSVDLVFFKRISKFTKLLTNNQNQTIMKKHLFLIILCAMCACASAYAQGRSISLAKKITTPYVTDDGDTLAVKTTTIQLLDCSGDNNQYRYVQLLNNANEPIQPATAKQAMKKQPIKFFKVQDDVTYAFTEYFCINIEAALYAKEIRILPSK